jgi:hypothetical protein
MSSADHAHTYGMPCPVGGCQWPFRISSHVWRPTNVHPHPGVPYPDRPCVYMACGRPRTEHQFPAPATPGGCPCPAFDSVDRVCDCDHLLVDHAPGGGACRAGSGAAS